MASTGNTCQLFPWLQTFNYAYLVCRTKNSTEKQEQNRTKGTKRIDKLGDKSRFSLGLKLTEVKQKTNFLGKSLNRPMVFRPRAPAA